MKTCKRCGVEKDKASFSPFKKSKDGLFSWCKQCNCELQKGRYANMSKEERFLHNRHKRSLAVADRCHRKQTERYRRDPEYRARTTLNQNAKRYGITTEEYQRRISLACEICGRTLPRVGHAGGMHIDHDHTTGNLRGTLCHTCNLGLGRFSDSPKLLRAAADYIEKYAPK